MRIIWVKSNRVLRRTYFTSGDEVEAWVNFSQSGQMMNTGLFWAQSDWEAGSRLSLGTATTAGSALSTNIRRKYVEPYLKQDFGMSGSTPSLDGRDAKNYVDMLSIFHQLTPPAYLKAKPNDADEDIIHFHRRLGRELDLSTWFTRPCLIILGTLEDSPCPIPFEIGGETVESDGTTIVRWIYPLPLDERVAFRTDLESTDE